MTAIGWDEARWVAAESAGIAAAQVVPLADSLASVLSCPLRALADLPADDVASTDGWALAGPGPWTVRPPRKRDLLAGHRYHDATEALPLRDGEASPVGAGDPVGSDVSAVVPASRCHIEDGAIELLDPQGGCCVHVSPGVGIRSRGSDALVGQELLASGQRMTPAAIALAALAGHDTIDVIAPPPVSLIRVGTELVDFGPPRDGLMRDATAPALPHWVAALGARCQPSVWVRSGDAELIETIEDAQASVIVTHGPYSGTALRRVLAGMGADVLIDGVACKPGGSMLLARLPDGTPLVHCGSGAPADALAAVVTLVAPVIGKLSGGSEAMALRRLDQTVRGSRDATWLIPVAVTGPDGAGVEPVLPGGPGGMGGWSRGTLVAVIPPGGVTRHCRTRVLPIPGAVT